MRNNGTHFVSKEETILNRFENRLRRVKGWFFTQWNKRKFGIVGGNFYAPERIHVVNGRQIVLGDNVFLGMNCQLYAYPEGRIVIGDNTSIDRHVEIRGGKELLIGSDVRIVKHSSLKAPENVTMEIGDRTIISQGCILDGGIRVGQDVTFGPYVFVNDEDHGFDSIEVPINLQQGIIGQTIIEDDVWIGNGVSILKNVTISKGAVIGAGAVVTKSVESYSINVGAPARKIKSRS